jgi:tetratricopeptide (TPR) repeat protein
MLVKYRSNDIVIELHVPRYSKRSEIRLNGETIFTANTASKVLHEFSVIELGEEITYRVIRSFNLSLGPMVDIIRAGKPVLIAHPVYDLVGIGTQKEKVIEIQDQTRRKIVREQARSFLANYELQDAEAYFLEDIRLHPNDPEPYYLLACVYSLLERSEDCLAMLRKSVALDDIYLDQILIADNLSFIRIQPLFSDFRHQYYLE